MKPTSQALSPSEWIEHWARQWKGANVQEGDVLLVHSSASRTLQEAKSITPAVTPNDLMLSFLRAVGERGTVLFPLFNFDWTKGIPFDIRSTPSQMGVVTEAARNHPNVIRTGHPIYSFGVIGALSEQFKNIFNASGYDASSPFAKLRELGGKIGILDLEDQNSMTFYHHVEEMNLVDYRYFKKWTNYYTDRSGNVTEKTFSLFVRNLEMGVLTDVNRMMERLWSKKYYQGNRPRVGHGFRTIDAEQLYLETESVIRSGQAKDFLYSIGTL